ncbi:MAG TPA: prolyl oligopeptidase family serine peptidase [Bacteroidales bacterium]|nr:prolyl oligopeptidase family serine peptidase [Bacteroidales bacterium]
MKDNLFSIIVFLGISLFFFACSEKKMSTFEKSTFVKGTDTLFYRILYPPDFNPAEKYPLILFLHGAGERGNNNESQLAYMGEFFEKQVNKKNFRSVVVAPQCPEDDYWAAVDFLFDEEGKRKLSFSKDKEPTASLAMVMAMMEEFMAKSWIDQERMYVGGLSMGGMGTFELLARKPDWFAAAFPICGGGDTLSASDYAGKTALWIFHGRDDDVVPVEHSVSMANAIREAGGNVKLTIYPNVGHASWIPAFAEPELMEWILSNRK